MKKIFYILCCQAILVSIGLKLSAQTSTITYISDKNMITANNGNASNVFISGSGVTVAPSYLGNYSWAGAVTYTESTGIQLSVVNTPPLAGTAYYVHYNFLAGSTYTITITASANIANDNPQTFTLNTSVVPVPQAFSTKSQTATVQDPNVISYSLQGFGFKTFTQLPKVQII